MIDKVSCRIRPVSSFNNANKISFSAKVKSDIGDDFITAILSAVEDSNNVNGRDLPIFIVKRIKTDVLPLLRASGNKSLNCARLADDLEKAVKKFES